MPSRELHSDSLEVLGADIPTPGQAEYAQCLREYKNAAVQVCAAVKAINRTLVSVFTDVTATSDRIDQLAARVRRVDSRYSAMFTALEDPDADITDLAQESKEQRWGDADMPKPLVKDYRMHAENRPSHLQAVYDAAAPPPALHLFDQLPFYQGPACMLKVSNPNFFREQWERAECARQEQAQRAKLEAREKRKREKAERERRRRDKAAMSTQPAAIATWKKPLGEAVEVDEGMMRRASVNVKNRNSARLSGVYTAAASSSKRASLTRPISVRAGRGSVLSASFMAGANAMLASNATITSDQLEQLRSSARQPATPEHGHAPARRAMPASATDSAAPPVPLSMKPRHAVSQVSTATPGVSAATPAATDGSAGAPPPVPARHTVPSVPDESPMAGLGTRPSTHGTTEPSRDSRGAPPPVPPTRDVAHESMPSPVHPAMSVTTTASQSASTATPAASTARSSVAGSTHASQAAASLGGTSTPGGVPPPVPSKRPEMPGRPAGMGNLLADIRGGKDLKRVETPPSRGAGGMPGAGGLLAEIQRGKNLKKVPAPDESRAAAPASGGLLAEIQAGRKLRHVTPNAAKGEASPAPTDAPLSGIAAILARRMAIAGDSSSESDESEWSD